MKTWKDIKDETLQLMFQYSQYGKLLAGDPYNKDYELAMPAAANYAMRDLASVRPIVRTTAISYDTPHNMIHQADLFRTEDVYVEAENAKAYYFEVDDIATITLGVVTETGWINVFDTIENAAGGRYTAYKGLISKTGRIRITFSGTSAYHVRHIAMYDVPYASADRIPPAANTISIDLKKLDRWMRLADIRPVLMDGRDVSAYVRYGQDGRLWLEGTGSGQIEITYYAYPTPITADTPDDFIPELDTEALDAVPLYMASRLFAIGDADRPMAVLYQNMYDAKKQELSVYHDACGTEQFVSTTGWI